jgi:hypothetical protein
VFKLMNEDALFIPQRQKKRAWHANFVDQTKNQRHHGDMLRHERHLFDTYPSEFPESVAPSTEMDANRNPTKKGSLWCFRTGMVWAIVLWQFRRFHLCSFQSRFKILWQSKEGKRKHDHDFFLTLMILHLILTSQISRAPGWYQNYIKFNWFLIKLIPELLCNGHPAKNTYKHPGD